MTNDIRKTLNLLERESESDNSEDVKSEMNWETHVDGWDTMPSEYRQKLQNAFERPDQMLDAFSTGLWDDGCEPGLFYNRNHGELQFGFLNDESKFINMSRSIRFREDCLWLGSLEIIDPKMRGQNIGKGILKSTTEACRKLQIGTMEMFAVSAGSYVWALAGFIPIKESWDGIRDNMLEKIDTLKSLGIDNWIISRLTEAVESSDPRKIWDIAACRAEVPKALRKKSNIGKQTIGKLMLLGDSWTGNFNLSDAQQTERLDKYCSGNLEGWQ